jgi:hypothetical protein
MNAFKRREYLSEVVILFIGIGIGALVTYTILDRGRTVPQVINRRETAFPEECPIWFDMKAKYYALEDDNKTPLNVIWYKSGVIRLESECMSFCVTGDLNGIESMVDIIKN